MLSESIFNDLI